MRGAGAPAWIGAILLVGGIVVAAAVNPAVGAVAAVVGAAVLWVVRPREASKNERG